MCSGKSCRNAWPVLHGLLSLDGGPNVVVALGVDESFEAIALGESVDHSFTMFPTAACEVARHADIQSAVGTVGHDVNPAASHASRMKPVDGRDKPGHDE